MADDLSGLLSDLPPDLVAGLGDLADQNATQSTDLSQVDASSYLATSTQIAVRPKLGKAIKLLGAALSYYGAGALQGILPQLATALGVQASDLLIGFLGKKSRGRKRRGITYRQISNARRVYGTVDSLYHRLHRSSGHHHSRAPYRHMKKRSR